MSRASRLLPSIGLSAVLLANAPVAHAFCRTTTAKQLPGCPADCVTSGLPLYWPTAHLSYVFNERGFPGFEDADLRRVIGESFGAWQGVSCEDPSQSSGQLVSVGLDIQADPGFTDLEVGPKSEEPNDNVVVHYSAQRWTAAGFDSRAFALTSIWFDPDSGRILGADMHFNGAMNFGECGDDGCQESDDLVDLRNVATHEAGHFVGLSHSDKPSSTMWCDARAGDVNKRSLSSDDIAGLCDIYPPGASFEQDRIEEDSGSCSLTVTPARRADGLWAFGLGSVALFAWRRRRRRS